MKKNQERKYGCGHEIELFLLDSSDPLSIAAYQEWEETTGDKGDKSECFDCFYNKRQGRLSEQEKETTRAGSIPWIIKFLVGIIIGAVVAVIIETTTHNLFYTVIAGMIAVFATRLALDTIG